MDEYLKPIIEDCIERLKARQKDIYSAEIRADIFNDVIVDVLSDIEDILRAALTEFNPED